jgi:hypothetical protein
VYNDALNNPVIAEKKAIFFSSSSDSNSLTTQVFDDELVCDDYMSDKQDS